MLTKTEQWLILLKLITDHTRDFGIIQRIRENNFYLVQYLNQAKKKNKSSIFHLRVYPPGCSGYH